MLHQKIDWTTLIQKEQTIWNKHWRNCLLGSWQQILSCIISLAHIIPTCIHFAPHLCNLELGFYPGFLTTCTKLWTYSLHMCRAVNTCKSGPAVVQYAFVARGSGPYMVWPNSLHSENVARCWSHQLTILWSAIMHTVHAMCQGSIEVSVNWLCGVIPKMF